MCVGGGGSVREAKWSCHRLFLVRPSHPHLLRAFPGSIGIPNCHGGVVFRVASHVILEAAQAVVLHFLILSRTGRGNAEYLLLSIPRQLD